MRTRNVHGRRAFFASLPVAAAAVLATSPAHTAPLPEDGFGEANDELIARDPLLKELVQEAIQTLPELDVRQALDMYRENLPGASPATKRRGVESGVDVRPMGSICFKVYKWQIVSVSWLISAGQTAEEVLFLGKTPWTNILIVLGAPRGSGAAIRNWAETATLPKTVCVSDEDI